MLNRGVFGVELRELYDMYMIYSISVRTIPKI